MARTQTTARREEARREELKHDAFRDNTLNFVERLGNRLEGKGKTILLVLGGLLALLMLLGVYNAYTKRQGELAQAALGKAIDIANAPIVPPDSPPPPTPTTQPRFTSERERAERAVTEFENVARQYSNPHKDLARYFAATYRLTLDRNAGLDELQSLTTSGAAEVASYSRFALAEARAADGQYDEAAKLYRQLLDDDTKLYAADTLNLRLATVLEKQGNRNQAVDILFTLAKEARERKDKAGKPVPLTAAAQDASDKLEELDPARYAQLPPEPVTSRTLGV